MVGDDPPVRVSASPVPPHLPTPIPTLISPVRCPATEYDSNMGCSTLNDQALGLPRLALMKDSLW